MALLAQFLYLINSVRRIIACIRHNEIIEPVTPSSIISKIPAMTVNRVPNNVAIKILLVSFSTLSPAVNGRVKNPRKKYTPQNQIIQLSSV